MVITGEAQTLATAGLTVKGVGKGLIFAVTVPTATHPLLAPPEASVAVTVYTLGPVGGVTVCAAPDSGPGVQT